MSTDFATVLDECLDRLKAGDSISACLQSYPEHAEELQPLLETAQFAQALRFTEPPRPEALARGRQRFLTATARWRGERRTSERSWLEKVLDFFAAGATLLSPQFWRVRGAGRAVAVILVAFLLFGAISGVIVQASESSLPGDPLYPVKQVTRQVQLITTLDPEAREEKARQIQAQERQEVRQATEQGRIFEEDVAGVIMKWDGRSLVLEGGLHIWVTDATQIEEGQPMVGYIAMVHVRSEDGRLFAERIAVREQAPVVVALVATETPTAVPTFTPEPTETPRPTTTPEPTQEPTKTPIPSNTPTPKPKATATRFPTATPVKGPVVHLFELRGNIDFISETRWGVAGQEIQVTSDTIIKGEPAVGRIAHVRANRLEDGTFVAIEIEVEAPAPPPPQKVFVSGVVERKESDTVWVISGWRVRVDDRTKIEGELQLGAFAEVEGLQESPTTVYAEKITVVRRCENPVNLEGTILSINGEAGIWVVEVPRIVDGQLVLTPFTIVVSSDTNIQNTPVVGAIAQIEACRVGDTYLARRIFVVPTPTPTDTPTVILTPELPSLQATPTIGPGVTGTPSLEASETPTPTSEASPTSTL